MESSDLDVDELAPWRCCIQRLASKIRSNDGRPDVSGDIATSSSSSSADLLVSLFMSALVKNYRRDTVLRPFPESYKDGTDKDFRFLEYVAEEIPPLSELLRSAAMPPDQSKPVPRIEALALLEWILDAKNFSLEEIPISKFVEIKRLTGQVLDAPCPNHIFEVRRHHVRSAADEAFESDGENLIYAFHGSRLENFHSILHNGLRNHMNKNSVFGEGTYLSSELSVCLAYSPFGRGWPKSIFGDKLSCVAVCQVIRHPDVKCHTRKNEKGTPSIHLVRSDERAAGNIPEKYYLVQNDDLVRVKYVLVYTDWSANRGERNQTAADTWHQTSWLFKHRFLLMMFAYVVVLLAIGLSSSSYFRSVSRRFTM